MFRYEEPQFEKKRLLRVEMLEQLRDYPRDYLDIMLRKYGDGILFGCEITWNEGILTVNPGILLYKKKRYFMPDSWDMECQAEDQVRYLKVQFLGEACHNGILIGSTDIKLDRQRPDLSCEMELCRFRLQKGARLRDTYENFGDYSTEYDTVDLIHVPYASEGGSTLNPFILEAFARESLRSRTQNPIDISFSMNLLAAGGRIPVGCIQEYLYAKLNKRICGNEEMYQGLLQILKIQSPSEKGLEAEHSGKRSIMLL